MVNRKVTVGGQTDHWAKVQYTELLALLYKPGWNRAALRSHPRPGDYVLRI